MHVVVAAFECGDRVAEARQRGADPFPDLRQQASANAPPDEPHV